MKQAQQPLPSYLQGFLDWLVHKRGLTFKTQKNYSQFLKIFFSWLKANNFSSLKPSELTLNHLDRYRTFLSSGGTNLKPTTQNLYLIAIRSLLTYFADCDVLSLSPKAVKLLGSVSSRTPHFLSFSELQKLLEKPNTSTVRGLRDRAIMELLLSRGFRISELVALNRNFVLGGLSKECQYWLERYLHARSDDKESALFVSWRNPEKQLGVRRIAPRTIQVALKKYGSDLGLFSLVTPRVLRHTQAQDLLTRSVDANPLTTLCRHSQVFLDKRYVKPIGPFYSVSSQSWRQGGFLWHEVEKRIQEEILWLQGVISTFSPKEQHAPDGCRHCFLRCVATLIVQGLVGAFEIRLSKGETSFWETDKDSFGSEIHHGRDWHRFTMSQIENHFLALGRQVVRQPILQQGRADLGVSGFGDMDLFIEIGTISLYKLAINFLTMNNFVYLIAPHEGVLIEFTKKQK